MCTVDRSRSMCWIPRRGQVRRGLVRPACRATLRRFLAGYAGVGEVEFTVEGCTGWRFIVEELERAGITTHLAEPAATADARGSKRRAKTDRTDARHLRQLLVEGRLPESWIPPEHVRQVRARPALYHDLREEHTAWIQHIHATLFHQGVPVFDDALSCAAGRARLESGEGLSSAGVQVVAAALRLPRRPGRRTTHAAPATGCLRPPPARLPGVADPLRRWHDHLGGDLGVHGRHPPVQLLGAGGTPHRAGRHRVLLRWQARPRTPGPAGTAGTSLGVVRGRLQRLPNRLTRPRLLPRHQAAHRPQTGRDLSHS